MTYSAEVTMKTKMWNFNARNTQKEYGSKTTVKTANDLHYEGFSSVEMFLGVTHKNFQAIHMYSLPPLCI